MMIRELGFRQGTSFPNIFYHPERGIFTNVHGDDFTSAGPADQLDWFEASVAKQYEITSKPRPGPGEHDAKSGIVLNRVIRWCEESLEFEADPSKSSASSPSAGWMAQSRWRRRESGRLLRT